MPPVAPANPADFATVLAWLAEGRASDVEAAARAALQATPTAADWWTALALSLSQQLRAAEALPLYQRLVQAQPEVAEHWSNLGNCLCELGREIEALAPLQQAVALGEDSVGLHFALARSLAASAQPRAALNHIDRALREDPHDPELRLLRARILVALDESERAAAEIAALRDPRLDRGIRIDAGNLLLQLTLYPEAELSFRGVLGEAPDNVEATIGLATTFERLNRLDEARELRSGLQPRTTELLPKVVDSLRQLDARLATRRDDHGTARKALEAILEHPPTDPAWRCNLRFELGRNCDALGDVDAAMQAFSIGHAERRVQVTAAHPALTRSDSLLSVLNAPVPAFEPGQSDGSDDGQRDPLFVVGFPRSGTTLLEQLLDAHEGLASFDEQPFVQRLITRLNKSSPGYPEVLPQIDGPLRQALRRQYFADVAKVRPDLGSRRPVDKNPLYIVRLPLVAALFPRAQVLLALRHPCDVVLSCFMQNFRAPAFAVTFETLASTAQMYDRVMRHYFGFAERIGLPTHVLRYEDLVADVPMVAKRLFAFLDLPWNDALLGFTERAARKGAISTPSYSQVVQPVSRKAVGRWQRYRAYFDATVMQSLQPWIERFGYDSN